MSMRMMLNKHYLGDDFYPAILDADLQDRVRAERQKRSTQYGRDQKQPLHKPAAPAGMRFRMRKADQHFDDPYAQAAYLYSLIEKED